VSHPIEQIFSELYELSVLFGSVFSDFSDFSNLADFPDFAVFCDFTDFDFSEVSFFLKKLATESKNPVEGSFSFFFWH